MALFPFKILLLFFSLLTTLGLVRAGGDGDAIKVWFFEESLFGGGTSVWVGKDECVSLEDTSVNGTVNSILINGDSVWDVIQRTDGWECEFFDNYECDDSDESSLYLYDGANSLAGGKWANRVLSVQCGIAT